MFYASKVFRHAAIIHWTCYVDIALEQKNADNTHDRRGNVIRYTEI